MVKAEFEKSTPHRLIDSVEYVPGSVVIRSILTKQTGTVTVSSFDAGEGMMTKSSPFDNLIQILDGIAEIIIEEKSNMVEAGELIIIPAHSKNRITANSKFKMLSTVIKSGYEDVSI
ncbi:quercetin dioxygenase-like cupin family protein [Algoriphagus sp. 4150]|uniref:cupin domain-containing protein n=1 Tax=Algoriphagus sp. 4150 TaxID=2817756 RepID=UPI00285CCD6C|nr:cupin domain-containing protein [Algoriphagus sp. 4150]MDR7129687.1 quercetin dioxygenase-like cupin family protein [Algoriphagus sp. 4150]